ncbi:bifunctional 4-hydroxy-2-oxoglutarate aldolase/2-dehydro-3-deoxy-phosphogluconate aldolase [Labedaea rhizosphaerae]|uniref:2-dehydro-3-deoxyphosphogluconate aldolase/(4S)-4-hydroxy-2-oxoglutarate aldolase n=1 Tax=Labedaea rhizosphaerae TaxID=598644 RepID=A0A4R6SGP4_LABRH|nr:bifunctional 4-hydroxy-2-oxoglutarate aldolase/2-dehydro-3-deoxy-phosphogluconate aldolase [Labedaea rhizosphaerae]TDQ00727.1 2-dehydro-3-deoxyphosphogluconate aldolase/(4S)-4-hydroxy-2-oxoglutarate aldolase [Labedaea rhizosphaerae]
MSSTAVFDQVRACGVVAIIRTDSAETARRQATRVLEAGLPVVEVSLTTPDALSVISSLAASTDAVIGAGTVISAELARKAIDAGSRILVSPNLVPAVVEVAVEHDVAVLPGCMTPTEMTTAMELGATAVKIFPAQVWSPHALRGLLQALPDLPTVPTGGIGPDDAADWIATGAAAVGVGSALTAAENVTDVVAALGARIARTRSTNA